MYTGGHDARTIARYSDLEYRVRSRENSPWAKEYPEPLRQARCLYFWIGNQIDTDFFSL